MAYHIKIANIINNRHVLWWLVCLLLCLFDGLFISKFCLLRCFSLVSWVYVIVQIHCILHIYICLLIEYDELCRNISCNITQLARLYIHWPDCTDSDEEIELNFFESVCTNLSLLVITGTYKRPSVSIWIIIRAWNCRQCKSYRMLQLAKAKLSHPIHRKAKISNKNTWR